MNTNEAKYSRHYFPYIFVLPSVKNKKKKTPELKCIWIVKLLKSINLKLYIFAKF